MSTAILLQAASLSAARPEVTRMSHHQPSTCPLCNQADLRQSDLRVHLMVEHRKSAVVDQLLSSLEESDLQAVSY
jgi:hypothetical protein